MKRARRTDEIANPRSLLGFSFARRLLCQDRRTTDIPPYGCRLLTGSCRHSVLRRKSRRPMSPHGANNSCLNAWACQRRHLPDCRGVGVHHTHLNDRTTAEASPQSCSRAIPRRRRRSASTLRPAGGRSTCDSIAMGRKRCREDARAS